MYYKIAFSLGKWVKMYFLWFFIHWKSCCTALTFLKNLFKIVNMFDNISDISVSSLPKYTAFSKNYDININKRYV